MKIHSLRNVALSVSFGLLLVVLVACTPQAAPSDPATIPSEGTSAPATESAPTTEGGGEGGEPASPGERYGCADQLVEYALSSGYPEATPLDPTTLAIPLIEFTTAPDCYFVDESSGAARYGAFWQGDPQGVLSSLGSALGEAGYVQSDDYGPLVWWVNGDDPTVSEHAVSAAPQPVDDVDVLWATW